MDPLTQLVELLRPRALLWKHLVGQDAWAWQMPSDSGVVFGRVVGGTCRYDVPEVGAGELDQGDYMLLTAPSAWILRGGDEDAEVVDFEDVPTDLDPLDAADDPEQVRIVGGHFEFDPANAELLTSFLAPIVHIRSGGSDDDGRLNRVFRMIDAEATFEGPGQEAVLSRLLEIALIELMRAPELLSNGHGGMLSGLTDPQIVLALRAFHDNIRRKWSVASLASVASMSRSIFSERFTSLVGQPPMTYVLNWRIAVARDALRRGGRSLNEVADATGYASASAFSTAFTRTVGLAPGRYARDVR
jgi:AraC-like DNA-binding protein